VQVAANTKGIQLVQDLIAEHSLETVQAYMAFIQANAGAPVGCMYPYNPMYYCV
jgi:5-oxoprolinase (ATP-hydrolysing)